MAKTAIVSDRFLSHNFSGGRPPYPLPLARGQREGKPIDWTTDWND
jgi:hypothetical protein